jgi:hypothetical protein
MTLGEVSNSMNISLELRRARSVDWIPRVLNRSVSVGVVSSAARIPFSSATGIPATLSRHGVVIRILPFCYSPRDTNFQNRRRQRSLTGSIVLFRFVVAFLKTNKSRCLDGSTELGISGYVIPVGDSGRASFYSKVR